MSPTFWRFLKYARPYWLLITGAILCGIVKFTLALALPATVGLVTDQVFLRSYVVVDPGDTALHETQTLTDKQYQTSREEWGDRFVVTPLTRDEKARRLFVILAVLAVAFLSRSPANYYRSYLASVAGNRTIFDIRRELHRHIQRLSLAYHTNRRTGATISRLINDLNAAGGILNNGVIAVSMDVVFLCGVVAFLFVWDWRLATASLFVMPFYGLVFRMVNPRLREAAGQVQEEMEEMSGEVTEKLAGVQVVMSFAREKTEEINFFHRHRRYYSKVLRRVRLKVILSTVAEFLTAIGPLVVIGYGGYRVIEGTFSVGQLLIFHGFLAHLYLPTRRLADCSAVLQEKLAAMDRVFEVLDSPPDILDSPGAEPLVRPQGRITLKDVHFAYQPDQAVLTGVSLTIEAGQSVAFVGRSGAGKSTLVNLVPRFYDVTDGAVLVDGRDVRDLTVRSLRENIGIVLQDSILFSGTIRENILYGRHNATEKEMIAAAEMAHIHEFVCELPDGYDAIIGERGLTLSGGQKQRISIARAFLRDPRILILDEATSSLDSRAENIIQEALRELMRGRTTLVIAHRLSTIVNCDLVVVLKDGQIVQQGSHRELIGVKGPYRKFCKEQFSAVHIEELSRKAG